MFQYEKLIYGSGLPKESGILKSLDAVYGVFGGVIGEAVEKAFGFGEDFQFGFQIGEMIGLIIFSAAEFRRLQAEEWGEIDESELTEYMEGVRVS